MYIPYSYYYSPSTSPSTTSYYYYFFEIPEEDLSKKSEIKVNVYGFIDIMKNIFNVFNSMSFPKYRLYVNDSKQEAIVEFGLAGYDKEDI
ncbi:MAG: hypothetical protein N3A54_07350, partial [Patescibacteria group bacterium]|nr:hypothetical protein [Patescibacteria group bacterium]